MADQTLPQTHTEEIRTALRALIAAGDDVKVDRLAVILERVLDDQRKEAEAEAKRKVDTFVPIPNLMIEPTLIATMQLRIAWNRSGLFPT